MLSLYISQNIHGDDMQATSPLQVRHLSYWGMMWAHGYQGEWTEAARCAQLLVDESRWSKCIYTYLQVSFLLAQRFEEEEG